MINYLRVARDLEGGWVIIAGTVPTWAALIVPGSVTTASGMILAIIAGVISYIPFCWSSRFISRPSSGDIIKEISSVHSTSYMTPLPWPPASRCILMVFLPWGLDGAAVDELMIQKRVAVIRSSAAISFDVFWGPRFSREEGRRIIRLVATQKKPQNNEISRLMKTNGHSESCGPVRYPNRQTAAKISRLPPTISLHRAQAVLSH